METLWQDLRFAARMLAKNPGFTAVLVLTLALGIGANTAIFSVVYGVLLRPLPYPQPERLVWFWDMQPALSQAPLSSAEYFAYRDQSHAFDQVAAIRSINFNLTGQGLPEHLRGTVVTPNYFLMLGVQPALGRGFSDADGQPGALRVALLTHGFWRRHFGGDPNIMGRAMTLNGEGVAVIGVLPAGFSSPPVISFYISPKFGVPEVVPNGPDPRKFDTMHYLEVLGRLKPGVTLVQAQSELTSIASHRMSGSQKHGVKLVLYSEHISGDARPTLLALLAVVGFVLLIACANVGNLLLARATSRDREMAVRAALGASAFRLVRQGITEGVLLSLAGALAGLPLAYGGLRALVAAGPQGLPRLSSIRLDAHALLFTFAIALFTGLLFGLAPALRGARVAPGEALKQAGRSGGASLRQSWLRSSLVISEIALSLVLLVGAGLLTRSFVRLLEVKPGFQPDHLLTLWVSFDTPKYAERAHGSEQMARFVETLNRLRALPGVQGVAGANDLPLEGQDTTSYPTFEGHTAVSADERLLLGMHVVTPGYFRAMGIPLLRGREIRDRDLAGAPRVLVINQAVAQQVWPGEDPIGKRMHLFTDSHEAAEEVVGVVGNVKHNGLHAEDSLDAYAPLTQQPWSYVGLAIRSTAPVETLLPSVRGVIAEFDPDLPVHSVRPMEQVLSESLGPRLFTLGLTGAFALLALALAGIGVYGVMSYAVASRTQEIGVRIALGAQSGDVLRLVVGQSMRLAGSGIAVGILGAFWLAQFLGSLLFGVKPRDPATFAGVALLLFAVALVACYIPARRAMRVDPLVALRYE